MNPCFLIFIINVFICFNQTQREKKKKEFKDAEVVFSDQVHCKYLLCSIINLITFQERLANEIQITENETDDFITPAVQNRLYVLCVCIYMCVCVQSNMQPFVSGRIFQAVFPPRVNIKGGGVHQWYKMFVQHCSINVQCFTE